MSLPASKVPDRYVRSVSLMSLRTGEKTHVYAGELGAVW